MKSQPYIERIRKLCNAFTDERRIELLLHIMKSGEADRRDIFKRVHRMYGLTNPKAEQWFSHDLNRLVQAGLVTEIITEPHPYNTLVLFKSANNSSTIFQTLSDLVGGP